MPRKRVVAPSVPPDERSAAEAAREIIAIEDRLARDERIALGSFTEAAEPGRHYPEADVWDGVTHAQYFFHAHPPGGGGAPAGHFHCFLGQAGMPGGMLPLILPEMALGGSGADRQSDLGTRRSHRDRGVFSHLIAVSLDAAGRPAGLFTTNRWVTGETWYRAEDVIRMLPRFVFVEERPSALIDRWLAAVLCLLRPEIAQLIHERDRVIMDWRRRRSRHQHVFEDRRLEIPSARPIDFAAALRAALTSETETRVAGSGGAW
jgi:hypothetical protein